MHFEPPLISGILIKRYKRFLADVTLDTGEKITCSVPNTGSMMGLSEPGSRVWLSVNHDGKRKYPHALQLVEADNTIVGTNTALPNRLVEEAILSSMISDLNEYDLLKREQKYGKNSRIDLLLEDPIKGKAYIEIKNVHLVRTKNLAEFPDSVTARGAKHLIELADMVCRGHRAIMVYLIQRSDCKNFKLCRDIDKVYCSAFDRAIELGVEAFAIRCQINSTAIVPEKLIPIDELVLTNNT